MEIKESTSYYLGMSGDSCMTNILISPAHRMQKSSRKRPRDDAFDDVVDLCRRRLEVWGSVKYGYPGWY